jgi:hypothetical protein
VVVARKINFLKAGVKQSGCCHRIVSSNPASERLKESHFYVTERPVNFFSVEFGETLISKEKKHFFADNSGHSS